VVIAPGRAKEAKEALRPSGAPEVHFPVQPFRQTPGPITTSQTYLRTLILERWDAEIRRCDDACKVQLCECFQGPMTRESFIRELIVGRWNAEKQRCQEAQKVQLLELLLAAHGITNLV
jgi:hypothetical protein